ncbi:MAG: hypothetical protein LQ350_005963 [Teloschistes chrysophthalmus]|nr:MAG: hypothetical protein LQ350_005963 [Niorma chrysophthalma]
MSSKSGPQIKRKSVPLIGKSAESFQIGPLSPTISESLTNGTSIPAPSPPTPPPKEDTMRPATPSQQQQTKGTLSNTTYSRFFPESQQGSMPGTFPADDEMPQDDPQLPVQTPQDEQQSPIQTPQKLKKMGYEASASASQSPYDPSPQASASSQSPRRPSSVFRLLPFKRKIGDRTSSSADSISSGRPQTPGAESIMGSLADSNGGFSLKGKKSGSFWGRRKSSLNYVTGAEGTGAMHSGNRAAMMKERTVSGGSGVYSGEDGDEEFPQRLQPKKSLTFWRRTSSMGLDKTGEGYGQQGPPTRSGSHSNGTNGVHQNEDTLMSEPDPSTLRPRSPPPQLPEVGYVVEEKGGLMGDEDWFGNIR